MKILYLCRLAFLLIAAPKAHGFVISKSSIAKNNFINNNAHESARTTAPFTRPRLDMRLQGEQRNKADTGGMQRGAVLMAIVMTICVWMFSIPPEFRRAKLCDEKQSAVYAQCQTPQQWTQGVADYYKNGGGIHFDFSIDPGTLAENEELRKSIFK